MSDHKLKVEFGRDFDISDLDPDLLNEKRYYELAYDQLLEGDYDRNLWAVCNARCDFDEKRAKALYVSEASRLIQSAHVRELEILRRAEEISRKKEEEMERELIRQELEEKTRKEEEEMERELIRQEWEEKKRKEKEEEEEKKAAIRAEKIQAWRKGRGGHPDDFNRFYWAVTGGVVSGIILSSPIAGQAYASVWVSIPIGSIFGFMCADLFNKMRNGS